MKTRKLFLPIKAVVSFFDIRRKRRSAPLFERGYKCVSFEARKKNFVSPLNQSIGRLFIPVF